MDVRLPDGTVIKNVPEDITKEALMARLSKADPGFLDSVKAKVNPPSEDIRELPSFFQGDVDRAFELYTGTAPEFKHIKRVQDREWYDPTAVKTTDEYGNVVFEGEKGRVYPDKPGFTMADIPQAVRATYDGLQVAAPSLAGGAAVAPLKAVPAALTMAGVGATSGGIREGYESAFEGRDYNPMVPVTEGAIDMAGEVGGRLLFRLLRPVAVRLFGKRGAQMELVTEDGQLTDDAIKILKSDGGDELLQAELAKMQRNGALTAEEAERANVFIRNNLQPTRAQVTRTADDFQAQQEAFKRSGDVRTALEAQDRQVREGFEGLVERSSGDPYQLVRDKVDEVDAVIDGLYKQAREAAPDVSNITTRRLSDALDAATGQDRASTGLLSAVKGKLKQMGAEDGITATQAEELRSFINSFYDSTTPVGKRLIAQFKDALDDDVFTVVGKDYFNKARAAKGQLEQSLNRTRAGRRDKRASKGLLRDVVENRVGPDEFLDKVRSKGVRADDLVDYREFLLSQEGGEQAWNALRRDVLDDIISRTFKGAQGESGVVAGSRNNLEKALDQWKTKLPVVFNKQERAFFDDMLTIMRYREPVPGTALGRGPSAQAVEFATERLIRRIPMMGDFGVDALRLLSQNVEELRMTRKVLDAGLNSTVRGIPEAQLNVIREELKRAFSPTGGAVAGAVIAAKEDE